MPRKAKIATQVAHVTCDSDTTFKVKRSKVKVTRPLYSPPCWLVRQLQRWAWERVGREKLLIRCRLLGGHGEERGGEYCVATRTACLDTISECDAQTDRQTGLL